MSNPEIYLFSVGINTYQSKQIPPLSACVRDVLLFQKTLLELNFLKPNNCLTLCNEAATRTQIVSSFRTHFSRLKDGDIAIFHFSGHGSWEMTDPAFIAAGYEPPGGKNETLVCHDNGTVEGYNIADKELRLLVAEIQAKKKRSTFIAFFDCCHSGSMMKLGQARGQARTIGQSTSQRPLNTLLAGAYERMLEESGEVKLPLINYLAFTACSPKELAFEDANGGYFTRALVNVLKQSQYFPSYAELHALISLQVRRKSEGQQHPYLEYAGEVKLNQVFLSQGVSTRTKLPSLSKEGDHWMASIGALHGLKFPTKSAPKFNVYFLNDLTSSIGRASIQKVYAEETTLLIEWGDLPLEVDLSQFCVDLPVTPLPIKLVPPTDPAANQELFLFFESQTNFLLHNNADYEVLVEQNQLLIFQKRTPEKTLLIGLNTSVGEQAIAWLQQQLNQLTRWNNLLDLSAPAKSKIPLEAIHWYFSYYSSEVTKKHLTIDEKVAATREGLIRIPYDASKNAAIPYTFEVEHRYQCLHGLYFYLIHLDRKYRIAQIHEHYAKPILKGVRMQLFDSLTMRIGLGISDPAIARVEDTFILLVSESPLTRPYSFQQDGFSSRFGKIVDLDSFSNTKENRDLGSYFEDNWQVKKVTIELVRS